MIFIKEKSIKPIINSILKTDGITFVYFAGVTVYLKRYMLVFLLITGFFNLSRAQSLRTMELNFENGIEIKSFNGFLHTDYQLPLVSFRLDSLLYNTLNNPVENQSVVVDTEFLNAFAIFITP